MVGGETTKKNFSGTNINPNTGATNAIFSGSVNQSSGGSLANLFLGYNFQPQTSRFVYGLELEGAIFRDLQFANEIFINAIPVNNSSFAVLNDSINSLFSIVGHVGFLVQPNTQVYGVIGGTGARFLNATSNSPVYPEILEEKWVAGLGAGIGVEHMFSNNWSVIAEYRRTNFNFDRIANAKRVNINATTNAITNVKIDLDMARVGIAYRPSVA
ncbi:outer membrane protein [Legionella waltersii]|uniref:Outer membrane protein beta-barrel domain-containing protein n=1 Tax=Legionella waltersii TaxID=66969 RepID=A0A0W1A066_9GAMM|nr:outer membrane beta-barrel protein [Legionella waltersii]KTD74757.1 hypothetical protein Lwal_2798 [Legionella waltersii]SNV00253.1 Opacity protein and related surface antigens [Legionella waltersii]